jgi:two-component system chemotaxis response regulator CheY
MKTVLVVEDTEDLRELFMEVLRQEGYQALGAENGQEALVIVSTTIADLCLVLLDLMMPVMDGEIFLKILRETYQAVALPVIVMSASVSERGVPGAARCMKKPVVPGVLVSVVREYCGPP